MRTSVIVTAGLLALALCSVGVTGCSGTTTSSGPAPSATSSAGSTGGGQATTSTVASAPAPAFDGSGVSGSGASTGLSAADRAAMKQQLDAMQKEIDALSLPNDTDFSDAAGAVY